MTDQVENQQVQQPAEVTLTVNVQQVNAILRGLGELPSSSGVWPLIQLIVSQAQSQLPEQPQETGDETVQ